MPRPTRVLFVSDTHCGHRAGLTPPPWQYRRTRDATPLDGEWAKLQAFGWDWFRRAVRDLQPIDVAVHVGDAIEGKGSRNAGTELITNDLEDQAEIAVAALSIVKPRRGWHCVYGTPYHTASDGQDWDRHVAERLSTTIHNHLWIDVDGWTVDVKHHVGGSNSVNGGDSSLRNEINQARAWHLEHGWPLCAAIVRGHVHRYRVVDHCRTMPSLQLWTKFGGRRCSGVVHFGLAWADIEGGEATWHADTRVLSNVAPTLTKA